MGGGSDYFSRLGLLLCLACCYVWLVAVVVWLTGSDVDLCCAGVSLKIMRMFRCVEVEGVSWLAADMRLQCYTSEWIAYGLTPTPSWHRVP